MAQRDSAIPAFRSDGYLPEGLFLATEAEVLFRFGASSQRRRKLAFGSGGGLNCLAQSALGACCLTAAS